MVYRGLLVTEYNIASCNYQANTRIISYSVSFIVYLLCTYLLLYVQASLFDSSEKREGSEVDLTKSKLQQTAEAWRCAC